MDSLVKDTKYGQVEGIELNGINMWLGVPFAQPPVGKLRFKRARELEPWNGIKKCAEMADGPVQFATGAMKKMTNEKHPKSEDCLYLNIKAPKNVNKAPVFVWIYGGANSVGEASTPEYYTDAFCRDGIIGVSFNYRVGALGFYDFSKLDCRFESNCAASDMITAMKWIHENIAEFGGDPANVTICGESAGGTAVYTLLSAPSAKGTFQKAIAQSGLASNITGYETHKLNNKLFFDQLGIEENDIGKLLTMPVEDMVRAGEYVLAHNNDEFPGILVTGPVIDDLIPWTPWEAMKNGNAEGVKCIFGTCRNEGNLFYLLKMTPTSWKQVARMLKLNNMSDRFQELKSLYAGISEKEAMQSLCRARMFWVDSINCTIAQSQHNDTYSYRYDFEPFIPKLIGLHATHGMDICCGLDTWKGAMSLANILTSKRRLKKIHKNMHGSFVNFCKHGKPGVIDGVNWEQYTKQNKFTFVYNDKCNKILNPNEKEYLFWKNIHLYSKNS